MAINFLEIYGDRHDPSFQAPGYDAKHYVETLEQLTILQDNLKEDVKELKVFMALDDHDPAIIAETLKLNREQSAKRSARFAALSKSMADCGIKVPFNSRAIADAEED